MRTRLLLSSLVALSLVGCDAEHKATNKHKAVITIQELDEMFARMRTYPKWNLDGDLLWGYFFTDHDSKKLEPLAKHLSETGYHVVSIYPADDNSIQWLHVERIEHHTAKTLDARNRELYALAEKFGVENYDGMDVGPVKANPK